MIGINHSLNEDYTEKKQGNLILPVDQKENKIPKKNSFSRFPASFFSKYFGWNRLSADHEKHIESSASIIENILSTGF